MKEMNEAEILARKIELREQHILLTLLDIEDKRKRLAILRNGDGNDREGRPQR